VGQTFPALSALIEEEYNQNPTDFKAIVFGTTANGVGAPCAGAPAHAGYPGARGCV
jgi:hypothetical protein